MGASFKKILPFLELVFLYYNKKTSNFSLMLGSNKNKEAKKPGRSLPGNKI